MENLMNTRALSFAFNGQKLRPLQIEGTPWFVATDLCRILGLSLRAGVAHHLTRLEKDEKRLLSRKQPTARHSHNNPLVITEGDGFEWRKGEAHATAISESGLYKLIMRANPSRPEVFNFQNWVTREVLPAIRKTGGYLLNEEARSTAHADNREAMPLPKEAPGSGQFGSI